VGLPVMPLDISGEPVYVTPYVRLQLNYVWKDTVNEYIDDLDDDIIYMNIQFFVDSVVKIDQ
jgi:hypothetical protein